MEIESLELTAQDILQLHRGWITKLSVDDNKSEVEIIELLYERRLLITCGYFIFSYNCFTDASAGFRNYGNVFKIGTYCRSNLTLHHQRHHAWSKSLTLKVSSHEKAQNYTSTPNLFLTAGSSSNPTHKITPVHDSPHSPTLHSYQTRRPTHHHQSRPSFTTLKPSTSTKNVHCRHSPARPSTRESPPTPSTGPQKTS